MAKLFEGIRVLDFTNNIAGPMATGMLADFGAEVTKVEKPGVGDDNRNFAPFFEGHSVWGMWMNRGKKSVALDMLHPDGIDIIKKLVAQSDIVVESFRPGVMEKLGFDYESLVKIKPDIIMCSVSAFGQTGPYSKLPGYDLIAQAMSGYMDACGEPDGSPMKAGFVVGDYVAGFNAYGAIVSALRHRDLTGEGQSIDVALLDCMVALNNFVFRSGVGEKNVTRSGNQAATNGPFGMFNGNDAPMIIAAANTSLWYKVCDAIGQPELKDEPDFAKPTLRGVNRKKLTAILETWLKSFPTVAEPIAILQKAGIPASSIKKAEDLLTDPHLRARGMITDFNLIPGLSKKTVPAQGIHIKFSKTPGSIGKPPILAQDQDEMLKRVGYSDEKIQELNRLWKVN